MLDDGLHDEAIMQLALKKHQAKVGESTQHSLMSAQYYKDNEDDVLAGEAGIIPSHELASKLTEAYGFDAEGVVSASSGLAQGTDFLSFVVKSSMLWTVRRMDTNADQVISWDEFRACVSHGSVDGVAVNRDRL